MKSAVIAVISTLAAAQSAEVKTKSVVLAPGAGANNLATSTGAVAISVIPGVSGSVIVSQVITYPAPTSNSIVQAWTTFTGSSDDGKNLYILDNATYGSSTSSAATISSAKRCGTAEEMAPPGALTVRNALVTTNCSLAVAQTMVQASTVFTQTATAAMLPVATSGSLVLGASLTVTSGWSIYTNPATTSAVLDKYTGSSATFTMDGAMALTLSSVAAAVAALTF
jgi:hypothetical protein